MSDYGAIINNLNGEVLINESQTVYAVQSVTSVTFPSSGQKYVDFAIPGTPIEQVPLVAVASNYQIGLCRYAINNGLVIGIRLVSKDFGATASVALLHCTSGFADISGHYGMTVYDANGNKTYDSRLRLFIPRATVPISMVTNYGDTLTFNKPVTATTPYYILNTVNGYWLRVLNMQYQINLFYLRQTVGTLSGTTFGSSMALMDFRAMYSSEFSTYINGTPPFIGGNTNVIIGEITN